MRPFAFGSSHLFPPPLRQLSRGGVGKGEAGLGASLQRFVQFICAGRKSNSEEVKTYFCGTFGRERDSRWKDQTVQTLQASIQLKNDYDTTTTYHYYYNIVTVFLITPHGFLKLGGNVETPTWHRFHRQVSAGARRKTAVMSFGFVLFFFFSFKLDF